MSPVLDQFLVGILKSDVHVVVYLERKNLFQGVCGNIQSDEGSINALT